MPGLDSEGPADYCLSLKDEGDVLPYLQGFSKT